MMVEDFIGSQAERETISKMHWCAFHDAYGWVFRAAQAEAAWYAHPVPRMLPRPDAGKHEATTTHARFHPDLFQKTGVAMRGIIFSILLVLSGTHADAQGPTYPQKLYYTCKVWGFVKYHHSMASNCLVDWNAALLNTLPSIKNSKGLQEFRDALDTLILAAGPMAIASTPAPDSLPPERRRNRDLSWIDDSLLGTGVRERLKVIRDNFRPHPICWVRENTGTGGWLAFPRDNPVVDIDATLTFPDESTRLLMLFATWNINSYFNMNLHVTDVPWDSTLVHVIPSVLDAGMYSEWRAAVFRMASALDDAHVYGLTASSKDPYPRFSPRIILRYLRDGYYVVKSAYPEIRTGDKIVSVDGRTPAEWEDSCRPFVSSGNISRFRYAISGTVLLGNRLTPIRLEYIDSMGAGQVMTTARDTEAGNWFSSYYPNDSLRVVRWRKWGCDIGYVNMGNLQRSDVPAMYESLKRTRAIIFDIRNYPNNTAWDIADLMYPMEFAYARLAVPNILYPGTCAMIDGYAGVANVKDPYKGKVIILCNESTISHAEYSCMILRAMPGAVVVGSQTAGADGNVSYFSLSPDMMTGFTTLGVYYPDGGQTQRIGIVPDSIVIPTPGGIRNGRDEVLEKALEIAGCAGPTEVSPLRVFRPIETPLVSVFPNPFRESTTIMLTRRTESPVSVKILDVLGRELLDLSRRFASTASASVTRAELLSPGPYFCFVRQGTALRTNIMWLLK